jgi:hypothetical protein
MDQHLLMITDQISQGLLVRSCDFSNHYTGQVHYLVIQVLKCVWEILPIKRNPPYKPGIRELKLKTRVEILLRKAKTLNIIEVLNVKVGVFILLLFASLPDCGQNQTDVSYKQHSLSDF